MPHNNLDTIADIYAQAFFNVAQQQQVQQDVRKELDVLQQLVRQHRDFAVFLQTPALRPLHKKELLQRVFADKFSPWTMNFLCVLADRNRLELIVPVYHAYTALLDESLGRVRGTLTTAFALAPDEQKRLHEQVRRALRQDVVLDMKTDPDIIAGLVLLIGDRLIDGSVRRSLQKLSQRLWQRRDQLPPPVASDDPTA